MNKSTIFVLILLALILGTAYWSTKAFPIIDPRYQTPRACTMEAKICPDGSAVGRTGPNCEFAACPTVATSTVDTSDWKTYTNEQYGFEFKYPADFKLEEPQHNDSVSYTRVSKLRPENLPLGKGCQGNATQSDEIEVGVSLVGDDWQWEQTPKLIRLGSKDLEMLKRVGGECGFSDLFLWKDLNRRVRFNISPSDTIFVEEYEIIISTFKFTK